MNLLSNNASSSTQSLGIPAVGIALSAVLHILLWALWSGDEPKLEPPITPAQVIEVALMSAPPQSAPEPPQPQVMPPPPPPKQEKPPEKPAPRKPDKPKPKPLPKKEPKPAPPEDEPPPLTAAPTPAVEAPPAQTLAKTAAPSPAPFVEASYKSPGLHNPPTRYPAIALERHWEGKVVLNVQVLPDGSAGEIRIESSSGHDILDDATVEQVKNWRFLPARRGDRAVASWVKLPIEYKLKH